MRKRHLYAVLGFLLGLGSPLGALLGLCLLDHARPPLVDFLVQEWRDYFLFFNYMFVATTLFFSLFGYFLGHRQDLLNKEVVTDPLTGLGNHRFLHEVFKIEFSKHILTRRPISCLMIDLDNFKKVNDTYGHPFGDCVLRHFASLIQKHLREGDVAVRYGGEEFLCILPNCDMKEARVVAERIRVGTEQRSFTKGKKRTKITISAGLITSYGNRGLSYSDLIDLSDQALYKAKQKGRNQVIQATTRLGKEPAGKCGPRP